MAVTKAVIAKKLREPRVSVLSHKDSSAFTDLVIKEIIDTLSKGQGLQLRGFGTFFVKIEPEHKTGLNEKMVVPEHGRILFRPCDELRKAVWNFPKTKEIGN